MSDTQSIKVYELLPLLEVFNAAGENWKTDVAVQTELARQGLKLVEQERLNDRHPQFAPDGQPSDSWVYVRIGENCHVESRYVVSDEHEAILVYRLTVDGECYIRFDEFDDYNSGLLPVYDALEYIETLQSLVERIRNANGLPISSPAPRPTQAPGETSIMVGL